MFGKKNREANKDPRLGLSKNEQRDSLLLRTRQIFRQVRQNNLSDVEKSDIFKSFIAAEDQRNDGVFEFPSGLEWFNVSGPLRFAHELKNKIVLFDFWTYCCINCMHILPELAELESIYENDPVAFIGIHAGKFEAERDGENVRNAIIRHTIHHPVVNDPDMVITDELGIRCWPSFVIFGPRANRLAHFIDDDTDYNTTKLYLKSLLEYFHDNENVKLNKRSLPIVFEGTKTENQKTESSVLNHPSKLVVDDANQLLYIADTANHRIVVTDLSGKYKKVIGVGKIGHQDGKYNECSFNLPNGLCLYKHKLYICDSDNHKIRIYDTNKDIVETFAGNGTRFPDPRLIRLPIEGPPQDQALSSPWDVTVDPTTELLYIAMAGVHEIWVVDLKTNLIHLYSGNGQEKNLNGDTLWDSAWSQPSSLTISNKHQLIVADSESSAIRMIDIEKQKSFTICGGNEDPHNLFVFGDVDGNSINAKLQHPLAVIWSDHLNGIITADSYNNKLKIVKLDGECVTWLGTGKVGNSNEKNSESFSEPSGLALSADGLTLYVADSNNNSIRVVSLKDKSVHQLNIEGVPKVQHEEKTSKKAIKVGPVALRNNNHSGSIRLSFDLPHGFHLTPGAPCNYFVSTMHEDGISIEIDGNDKKGDIAKKENHVALIPFKYKITNANDETSVSLLKVRLSVNCCNGDSSGDDFGGICSSIVSEFVIEFVHADISNETENVLVEVHRALPSPVE